MFTPKNKVVLKLITHILVWVFLLLFPYLLTNSESLDLMRMIKFTWVPILFYALIFYLNYLYLIENYLFRKKTLSYILINLALILALIWLHLEIREFLNMISETKLNKLAGKHKLSIQLFIYKDLLSMLIPVIASIAAKTTEKWSRSESEKQDREKALLNSELQHLRYQLQPHFFFNSLNTIYALIENSPKTAQETVHSLSKLMRYMLYDADKGKVSLSEEIGFMTQYINVMRLRVSGKTQVRTDFLPPPPELRITPLLFISLIENAFKHGVSATQPSDISFHLAYDKNTIHFTAVNTNFPKTDKDKSGSGIGLINLKKRLELSYPKKHIFETKTESGLFIALLEINTE